MVLVLVLGGGVGWFARTRLRKAEADSRAAYESARLVREVARLALVEYREGVYKSELETIQGELTLAETQRKQAEDRLAWSDRMYEKGEVSRAQNIADKVSLKQKAFAYEQALTRQKVLLQFTGPKTLKEFELELAKARADESAKKAAYDRVKASWLSVP
jgi:hypothetical protein